MAWPGQYYLIPLPNILYLILIEYMVLIVSVEQMKRALEIKEIWSILLQQYFEIMDSS